MFTEMMMSAGGGGTGEVLAQGAFTSATLSSLQFNDNGHKDIVVIIGGGTKGTNSITIDGSSVTGTSQVNINVNPCAYQMISFEKTLESTGTSHTVNCSNVVFSGGYTGYAGYIIIGL